MTSPATSEPLGTKHQPILGCPASSSFVHVHGSARSNAVPSSCIAPDNVEVPFRVKLFSLTRRSQSRRRRRPRVSGLFARKLRLYNWRNAPKRDRVAPWSRRNNNMRLRWLPVDKSSLAEIIWKVTLLLDELGLFTPEVFQKRREEVIVRQQREITELSTPVVKLWDGILALPLIGTLDSRRTQVVMENLLQTRGRNCDYRSEYGGQRRKRRSGAPMKLNSTQVEQTLSKLNAEVLADDHSAITQLIKMFGDHTFFLVGRGLKILEPGEVPEMGPGEVVSLADWSDSTLTSLRPHEPEPSGMTVVFSETKH
jgi:hypothetical protein